MSTVQTNFIFLRYFTLMIYGKTTCVTTHLCWLCFPACWGQAPSSPAWRLRGSVGLQRSVDDGDSAAAAAGVQGVDD